MCNGGEEVCCPIEEIEIEGVGEDVSAERPKKFEILRDFFVFSSDWSGEGEDEDDVDPDELEKGDRIREVIVEDSP